MGSTLFNGFGSTISAAGYTQNSLQGGGFKSTYRSKVANIRVKNMSTSQNEEEGLESVRENSSLGGD